MPRSGWADAHVGWAVLNRVTQVPIPVWSRPCAWNRPAGQQAGPLLRTHSGDWWEVLGPMWAFLGVLTTTGSWAVCPLSWLPSQSAAECAHSGAQGGRAPTLLCLLCRPCQPAQHRGSVSGPPPFTVLLFCSLNAAWSRIWPSENCPPPPHRLTKSTPRATALLGDLGEDDALARVSD